MDFVASYGCWGIPPQDPAKCRRSRKANAAKIALVANLVAYSNGSSSDDGGARMVDPAVHGDWFIRCFFQCLVRLPNAYYSSEWS